jgi:hypothetical protein
MAMTNDEILPQSALDEFPQLESAELLFCLVRENLDGVIDVAIWWADSHGAFELLVVRGEAYSRGDAFLEQLRVLSHEEIAGIVDRVIRSGFLEMGDRRDRNVLRNSRDWVGLRIRQQSIEHWVINASGGNDSRIEKIYDLALETAPEWFEYGVDDDEDDIDMGDDGYTLDEYEARMKKDAG